MSEPQMGTGSGLGPREAPGTTIVLVHGAFADASGFGGVIRELKRDGHTPSWLFRIRSEGCLRMQNR